MNVDISSFSKQFPTFTPRLLENIPSILFWNSHFIPYLKQNIPLSTYPHS